MRRLILAPRWLQFFIVVLVIFGIFFRFVNLDGKVYSLGETDTLLRISGYTTTQVKQQLFNCKVINKLQNFKVSILRKILEIRLSH